MQPLVLFGELRCHRRLRRCGRRRPRERHRGPQRRKSSAPPAPFDLVNQSKHNPAALTARSQCVHLPGGGVTASMAGAARPCDATRGHCDACIGICVTTAARNAPSVRRSDRRSLFDYQTNWVQPHAGADRASPKLTGRKTSSITVFLGWFVDNGVTFPPDRDRWFDGITLQSRHRTDLRRQIRRVLTGPWAGSCDLIPVLPAIRAGGFQGIPSGQQEAGEKSAQRFGGGLVRRPLCGQLRQSKVHLLRSNVAFQTAASGDASGIVLIQNHCAGRARSSSC